VKIAGLTTSGGTGFNKSDPKVKNTAFNQALQIVTDPTTGKMTGDIPSAVQRVNGVIRSYGWSLTNPNVLAFRNNILKTLGVTPDPAWR
jgi:hypothetical protein